MNNSFFASLRIYHVLEFKYTIQICSHTFQSIVLSTFSTSPVHPILLPNSTLHFGLVVESMPTRHYTIGIYFDKYRPASSTRTQPPISIPLALTVWIPATAATYTYRMAAVAGIMDRYPQTQDSTIEILLKHFDHRNILNYFIPILEHSRLIDNQSKHPGVV